jgi:hypothetical protein
MVSLRQKGERTMNMVRAAMLPPYVYLYIMMLRII